MSDWIRPHLACSCGVAERTNLTLIEKSLCGAEMTADQELEAAIKYKIATAGLDGVHDILALVREALQGGVHVVAEDAANG